MKAQFEHIQPPAGRSFQAFLATAPVFASGLHYHPEVEITLVQQSRGRRVIGDHLGTYEPMDLCLIGRELPHLYHGDPAEKTGDAVDVTTPARAEVIQFHEETFDQLLDAPEMRSVTLLLEQARRGLHFPAAVAHQVAPLMQRARLEEGPQSLLALWEILSLLSRHKPASILASPGFVPIANPGQQTRIGEACRYLLDHFDEDLTHEQVAARAGLSPSAFSRLFRRITRQSYTQFLSEIRLGHACRLLLETDLSVAEICFASGFRNLSNFNRRFRHRHQCSPLEWRRTAQQSG